MKIKTFLLILTAALLLGGTAGADIWQGSVIAAETTDITAPADGQLTSLELEPGQWVSAGSLVGEISQTRVFAPADGTIAAIHAEKGDKVAGTVLEISPTSLYLVTCTVSNVSKTAEASLIHSGETVYMKCTADGSHRATGRVTKIDGTSYEVEVLGGELYVGETVYVYRNRAFATDTLIGKGTVTSHDTLAVEGTGTLLSLRVEVGDRVARGQWLFTTAASDKTQVTVPADGIITEVKAAKGSSVQEDGVLASIATASVLRIEVSADDAARFKAGDTWYYTRNDDPHETHAAARVKRVLTNESDASAAIELVPLEAADLPLGLTICITDEPGLED